MIRSLVLVAVGAGLWLVLAVPAWLLAGDLVLLQASVALALSLLPALATMIWVERTSKASSESRLIAILGGSLIRMGIALGIGAALYFHFQETFSAGFLVWVLVFYMALLVCEVTMIVRDNNRPATH